MILSVQVEDLEIDPEEILVVNCLYRMRNVLDKTVVENGPNNLVLRSDIPLYNAFDIFEATCSREDQDREFFEQHVLGWDIILLKLYANENCQQHYVSRPGIENHNAKDFLKLVEEKFCSTDKALAGTLMDELTTMKLDGLKSMQQHVLDMTNTAARLKTLGVDKKLKQKANSTTSKVANGEKKEQHNNKCTFCKKEGHFQKDCPKRKAWFEKKAEARVYNPQEKKLDSRTVSGYFIGYPEKSKGYKFYHPNHSFGIVKTSNAKFLENGDVSGSVKNQVVNINKIRDDDPSPIDVHKFTTTQDVVLEFQNQEQYLNNDQTSHEENNIPTQTSEPVGIALNIPARVRKSAIHDDYIVYLQEMDFDIDIDNDLLHQIDVKTAFLNGNIEEESYTEQPEGFFLDGNEKMVCKLKKSIYGLKLASRRWYIKFNDTITSFGFEEIIVDRCIYRKISGSKFIFLVLYVDDILLATNDFGLLHKSKGYLSKNFEMKDMGEASYMTGISIFRDVSKGLGDVDTVSKPLKIYCDNAATIFFSKNDKYSKGAKHMDIKFFIVKEEIQKQRVYLEHISTDLMIVDPLTKGLPPKEFMQHVLRLGLGCIDN
ncbi:retrovirus-related pol polyprotein from transposon TNT 1-94 [Tanacetum coccineum]